MAKPTKYIDRRIGEITRPDISPEQEAEICGLSVAEVRILRQRLEEAHPGPEYERAWDDCVRFLSVALYEAGTVLGLAPVQMMHRARQGQIRAFQHHNRWRMWKAHVVEEMEARGMSWDGDERGVADIPRARL